MPAPLFDRPLSGVLPHAPEDLPRIPAAYPPLPASGLMPDAAPSAIDWTRLCVPADDQREEPSCVGRAWAGWMEAMLRRYLGPKTIPHRMQLDARAIWIRGRDLFWGGDRNGGLHLDEGAKAAIDIGVLPAGTRLVRIDQSWGAAGEALAFTPLVQAHELGPGWHRPQRENGCIDHSLPPDGGRHGYHATLLAERTVTREGKFLALQNSWGSAWGFYGFGVMSASLWETSLIPSGLWSAILPPDWQRTHTRWKRHLIPA